MTMGHYCRICGDSKSNESFSGRGHRDHVCKSCGRLPKSHRQSIENKDEVFGFLKQSHISAKNVIRFKSLKSSTDRQVSEYATIVLEVAKVHPYKKRRLKELACKRRDLFEKLEATGLIWAHHF